MPTANIGLIGLAVMGQNLVLNMERNGYTVAAFGVSLAYYDSYRSERLPANLIQARRDFFGAHTNARIDKPGTFHSQWE